MSLEYTLKHFSHLTNQELYAILEARIAVFCVEQNCPYQDCDGKDLEAYHVLGKDADGVLQTYCRLLEKGVTYESYASIGRVLTSAAYRGKGEGKVLMRQAIQFIGELYPMQKVKISAQCYARVFYESLCFEAVGEEYLEDDIPHISMVLDGESYRERYLLG
jgi:ElaA protein